MTRGRDSNIAYVATDQPDPNHSAPRPSGDPETAVHTVLARVLQHSGAELPAHQAIDIEDEAWGNRTQLCAEYETLLAAAQHDRWSTFVANSEPTTVLWRPLPNHG